MSILRTVYGHQRGPWHHRNFTWHLSSMREAAGRRENEAVSRESFQRAGLAKWKRSRSTPGHDGGSIPSARTKFGRRIAAQRPFRLLKGSSGFNPEIGMPLASRRDSTARHQTFSCRLSLIGKRRIRPKRDGLVANLGQCSNGMMLVSKTMRSRFESVLARHFACAVS